METEMTPVYPKELYGSSEKEDVVNPTDSKGVVAEEQIIRLFQSQTAGPYAIWYLVLGIIWVVLGILVISVDQSQGAVAFLVGSLIFGGVVTFMGIYGVQSEKRIHELILTSKRIVYRAHTISGEKKLSYHQLDFYLDDIVRMRFTNQFWSIWIFIAILCLVILVGSSIAQSVSGVIFAVIVGGLCSMKIYQDQTNRVEWIRLDFGHPRKKLWMRLSFQEAMVLFQLVNGLRQMEPELGTVVQESDIHVIQMRKDILSQVMPLTAKENVKGTFQEKKRAPLGWLYVLFGLYSIVKAIQSISERQDVDGIAGLIAWLVGACVFLFIGFKVFRSESRLHEITLTNNRVVYRCLTRMEGRGDGHVSILEEHFRVEDLCKFMFSNRFHTFFFVIGVIYASAVIFCIIAGIWLQFVDNVFWTFAFAWKVYRDYKYRKERIHMTVGDPKLTRHVPMSRSEGMAFIHTFHSTRMDLEPLVSDPDEASRILAHGRGKSDADGSVRYQPPPIESGPDPMESGELLQSGYETSPSDMQNLMTNERTMGTYSSSTVGRWFWVYLALGIEFLTGAIVIIIIRQDRLFIGLMVMLLIDGIVFTAMGLLALLKEKRLHEVQITSHRVVYRCNTVYDNKKQLSYYHEEFYAKDIGNLMFSNRFHTFFPIMLTVCVALMFVGFIMLDLGTIIFFLVLSLLLGAKCYRDWKHRLERIHIVSRYPPFERHVPMTQEDAGSLFHHIHVAVGKKPISPN
eukprot:TRINITY_DN2927_c0_g1_i1.p1 TRINITY_DN2927_c0_g1~~TRINITY_DN2927_c0_g1_i1.p1  ORF type:complete len:776 (+),score=151.85 TRINITY_DN2927_c0_g1_i1:114-2330(+)